MKKKQPIVLVTIAVLLLTVYLISESGSEKNKTGVTTGVTYDAPDLKGQKITVLTNKPHLGSSEALAEWFHKETGAIVQNIVVDYSKMRDRIIADAASSEPLLDVVMFWYVDIGKLVEEDSLIELTDFIDKNSHILEPDDYLPSLYDPYTLQNGKRWALPYDGDTHVLFYRKSLLEKYHLTPPDTWEQFQSIARTITENEKENGVYGTAIMAPPLSMMIISSFMNRLGCFGGKLLNDSGKPSIDSPEAVMALNALIEHSIYALPTPFETDWEVSRDAFLTGKVAMVEQWTDIGIMAEELSQSTIQGDWGVIQMPLGKGEKAGHVPALNAGFSLGIAKSTRNLEAAKAYLLFASHPATTLKLNLINGGIDPVRISTLNSKKYKAFAPKISIAAKSAIGGATAWPTIPRAAEMLEILTDNLVKAIHQMITPQQALENTQKSWQELMEKG